MHKIHHKIILGIAAVAVIAGIVYVANQTKGQVATCAPVKVALNKSTTTYKSTTGDTIIWDGTTLSSSNLGGAFTIDNVNWTTTLSSELMKATSFTYVTNLKQVGAPTEVFNDVTLSTLTGDLSFTVTPSSVKETTLTEVNATYTTKNGVMLTLVTADMSLVAKNGVITLDGGRTYLNMLTLTQLEELAKTGLAMEVALAPGGVNQALSVRRVDSMTKSLTISEDVGCAVPPDPCDTKVSLSKANPNFTSPIGTITYEPAKGILYSADNLNMAFSSNNIDYFPNYDVNMAQKIPLVYVKDMKTGEVLKLTNASYDPIGFTFGFDYLAPTTKNVVLSKTSPTYTAKDGTILALDPSTFSLSATGSELSIDGVKYMPSLGKTELTTFSTLYVRNLKTGTITQVAMKADTYTGTLTLTIEEAPTCGPKDTDNDGVADDVDKCPNTIADTVTNLKPRNLAVFDVGGTLTWMTNVKTAKSPVIEPVQALSLATTMGCNCDQILDLKETKEKIDDDKNESEGNYGDEDRASNIERDEDNNNSRLKYGCTALGGKDNTPTTKVTGIVGDFIRKAAKWSDDRSDEEKALDEESQS